MVERMPVLSDICPLCNRRILFSRMATNIHDEPIFEFHVAPGEAPRKECKGSYRSPRSIREVRKK
jgi:hypothetical protein